MTLIVNELYDNIIRVNASDFPNLRVITGYSSRDFVKKIITEFPELKIELYIGMALQGISEKDHVFYQKATKSGKAVVRYVVKKPMIHQKVLEFYDDDDDRCGYIGSANFSDGGFCNQREVMAMVDNSLDYLFDCADASSFLCIDSEIDKIVPIVDDETFQNDESASNDFQNYSGLKAKPFSGYKESENISEDGNHYSKSLESDIELSIAKGQYIDVPVFFNNRSFFSVSGCDSSLSLDGIKEYSKIVPGHSEFEVEIRNGRTILADTNNSFGKYILFHDFNIRNYIAELLEIDSDVAFNKKNMCDIKIELVLIKDNHYVMGIVKDGIERRKLTF